MKYHLATLPMTTWRKSLIALILIVMIGATFHGRQNGMYASFLDVIDSFGAVAGLSSFLLISAWTAGDLSNNIGTQLLLSSSNRVMFVLRRIGASIVVSLALTILFSAAALLVRSPSTTLEWVAPFGLLLGITTYVFLAIAFSFLVMKTIPAVIFCLVLILAVEPLLRTLGFSADSSTKWSPEAHIGDVLSGTAGIDSYIAVLLIIAVATLISVWRGIRIHQ